MPQYAKRRGRILTPVQLTVTGALLITLASFISVSILTGDFKISVAIVLLPVFAFLAPDFRILAASALSAVGVFLCRGATDFMATHTVDNIIASYSPEMAFYLCYGVLLSLFYRRASRLYISRLRLILPLTVIDVCSNLLEVSIRLGFGVLEPNIPLQLMAVAACRSLAAAFILWCFDSYGLQILRREDAERYQRLLIMTSTLESEVYWLEKSEARIETTMASAYNLYQELSSRPEEARLSEMAIDIAKDIHEVKKQYILITRGIDHTLKGAKPVEDGMEFEAICDILKDSLTKQHPDCELSVTCEGFYTRHHYALMSVLHNLLGNAIEAAGAEADPAIALRQWREGEYIHITVSDNCGGIDPAYIDQIFLPGFSSKMDPATGEINRGLGLCIVKEIVEARFGGSIGVGSENGGTTFHITILAGALEEKQ